MTDVAKTSNEQLIAIEMKPLEGCAAVLVSFNRPFTHVEMNAMHRALNEHLIPHDNETGCVKHAVERRVRDTLPCPWCVIDELKRNRDAVAEEWETAKDAMTGATQKALEPQTDTTSAAAKVAGAKEADRSTSTYTADNVDSKGVAAVGHSRAPGDPCPVCATGRLGQSGYNYRCANCGWLGPRVEWAPNAQSEGSVDG